MTRGQAGRYLHDRIHEKEVRDRLAASHWTSATVPDRSVRWQDHDGGIHTLSTRFTVSVIYQTEQAVNLSYTLIIRGGLTCSTHQTPCLRWLGVSKSSLSTLILTQITHWNRFLELKRCDTPGNDTRQLVLDSRKGTIECGIYTRKAVQLRGSGCWSGSTLSGYRMN